MTSVVNLKTGASYDVYIGRAGKGQDGYFGNPHPIGYCELCNAKHDRSESLEKFREYFNREIAENEEFRSRVLTLKGKVLGCFCSPLPCHGQVIVEWLENL